LPVCAGSSRAKQGLAGNDPPYTVAYGQGLKFGGMLDLEDESIKIFRNVGNFTRGHGAINRNTSLFNSIAETLAQPRCLPVPYPVMPCPALPCPALPCVTPQYVRCMLLQYCNCNCNIIRHESAFLKFFCM
jgi:hypothetical protein